MHQLHLGRHVRGPGGPTSVREHTQGEHCGPLLAGMVLLGVYLARLSIGGPTARITQPGMLGIGCGC